MIGFFSSSAVFNTDQNFHSDYSMLGMVKLAMVFGVSPEDLVRSPDCRLGHGF